jgi:hypothetical protein
LGKVLLKDYAERGIAERPKLRPRTVQLYQWILGKRIVPYFGDVPLAQLSTPMVRSWRVNPEQ